MSLKHSSHLFAYTVSMKEAYNQQIVRIKNRKHSYLLRVM